MTAMLSKCPNPVCACPVQPGDAFCPNCGQALGEAPAGQVSDLSLGRLARESDLAGARPSPDAATLEPPNALDFAKSPELVRLAGSEEGRAPAETPAEAPRQNDCSDLEVRYNNSCVFVLNMQSTFDFEICPLAEGIRDLFVEARQAGQMIARETPMVLPKRGVPIRFGLNHMPRNTRPGKVSFLILVGYRKGSERRLFAAYRTHTIYSGKEDPRRVCDNLVVEVKNNIQQGHAGDVRVDQSFDELREALREQNSIALDKEFLDLIDGRPFWAPLALAECSPDALPASAAMAVPPEARRRSLILRQQGGTSLHLLTQDCVQIGRQRECEIITRVLDASDRELRDESLRVSQYHAQIEWSGSQCRLWDRGNYPGKGLRPSTRGTWVDGQRLPRGSHVTLVSGHDYRITLAAAPEENVPKVELRARVWVARDLPPLRPGCPEINASPETPVGLVLRQHPGNTAYLLLRSHASLGWVDPRWTGACVCLRGNALHFSAGLTCDWLVPGCRLRSGAAELEVLDSPTRSKAT